MLEGGSALFERSLFVMASYGLCPSQEQAPVRRRLDIGVYSVWLIGAVIDLHQSRRGSGYRVGVATSSVHMIANMKLISAIWVTDGEYGIERRDRLWIPSLSAEMLPAGGAAVIVLTVHGVFPHDSTAGSDRRSATADADAFLAFWRP